MVYIFSNSPAVYLKLFSLVLCDGLKIVQAVSHHGQCGLHGLVSLGVRLLHQLPTSVLDLCNVVFDTLQFLHTFLHN